MKKLITFLFFIQSILLQSQAPQSFNYQATVRNNSGQLVINQNVYFKFNIIPNFETGIPVYSETHFAPTDELGHVNIIVGQGSATIGIFSQINWASGSYFMNIELNTGNGYINMGTTQLLSVPYALFAQNAGSSSGILNGTQVGQMVYWNGSQWTNIEPGLPGTLLNINPDGIPRWNFTGLIKNVSCYGESDGAIELFFPENFNTSICTFQWTGPNNFSSNAQNISNLFPGVYSLVVTQNGVATSISPNFIITMPQELPVENTNNLDVTCHGGSDGQCTVNVTQGIFGNYTYEIYGKNYLGNSVYQTVTQSSPSYTFLGLAAGIYSIKVFTDTSCYNAIDNVIINQPSYSYSIVGTFNLTTTRLDTGVVYNFPNENITEVLTGTYLTSSTGPYTTVQLTETTTPGFKFNIVCGSNQVIVPLQQLGNVYSNLVQQSPSQAEASFVNSNGTITIEYSVWFTGNTVERPYRGVYIPN